MLGALVLFELAAILVIPELRTWDGILHHFSVCIVCAFTFYPRPFGMFYSCYFSAFQELSSVPAS